MLIKRQLRPRGMGWGARWEGRSGWGAHINPWLIHVSVWQKPLQYCKVISLQLIKINGKKPKEFATEREVCILMKIFKTKIYIVGLLKVKMCVDVHICGFYTYMQIEMDRKAAY